MSSELTLDNIREAKRLMDSAEGLVYDIIVPPNTEGIPEGHYKLINGKYVLQRCGEDE